MIRKKNNNSAFTLIELLVVIAIIAILAAILFPVFAQAKVAAKKATSISNIKQLGTSFLIYTNDFDDRLSPSEYGSGGHPSNTSAVSNWATINYPYMKSGNMVTEVDGSQQATGCGGLVQDTAASTCPAAADGTSASHLSAGNAWYPQGFSYGVNINAMPSNIYSDAYGTMLPHQPIATTQIDNGADKMIIMSKGLNSWTSPNVWNYPWFSTVESQYLGAGVTRYTAAAGWTGPDGDDSANPAVGTTLADGFVVKASYDTDCSSTTNGAWECAAHPRYRYGGTGVAAFSDSHAKSVKKGSLQWYKNIYINNPGINASHWFSYEYQITPQ